MLWTVEENGDIHHSVFSRCRKDGFLRFTTDVKKKYDD